MNDDKDVQGACVFTLDELEAQSDVIRGRYEALSSAASEDSERSCLVDELQQFLKLCVVHGRYMQFGTTERRSLRNLVNYWTSRLSEDRYNIADIGGLEPYDPNEGVPLNAECPYPGLEPYDDRHKGDFFGREKLAGEYADNLEAQGVFLIVGGSGSGKSSVALAGVRPACQQRHPDWRFPESVKPGSDPLGALAASIAKATAGDVHEMKRRLEEKPADAARILGAALGHRPTLLIIDQFEEVLTLCRDADAQKAFAEALLALVPHDVPEGGRPFYLLFTLRNDHSGRFDNNPGLQPLRVRLMQPGCNANLPSMQQHEILQAILKPAGRVRLRFVPTKVAEDLAGQTASLTNGLPLLQFALQRLWWEDRDPEKDGRGRPRDFINEDQLKALPDVSSALGMHAERVYKALKSPQKEAICQRLILELVFLDENFTEPLRRRRAMAELLDVIGGALRVERAAVCEVIEKFSGERLLRKLSENGEDQLEVAHEALLRHWDTISTLVYGDEAKARLFRIKEVLKEAAEWKKNACSEGWLKQHSEPLIKVERDVEELFLTDRDSLDYVKACRAYEDEIKRREKEKQKAETEAQRARAAQERAEWEKSEAVRQEQERAKNRKRMLVLAVLSVIVVGFLGARDAKQRNNSNLSVVASLSDRLPPWEGLDLTQALAQKEEIFSTSLGHALERMDDARIVGARGSVLTVVGDGTGLMEIPKLGGGNADTVYLYRLHASDGVMPELLSSPKGVAIRLGGKFQGGNLGAAIKMGPHRGKHMFVAMVATATEGSFRAEAWLVDFDASMVTPIEVPETSGFYASQIAMRPDGLEASWGVADARRHMGSLVRLGVEGYPVKTDFRLDPKMINQPEQIVDALGYVSGQDGGLSLVLATGAGLFCGKGEKLAHGPLQSGAPAVAIATVEGSDVFAVGYGNGRVELARCGASEVPELPQGAPLGNPSSVSLQRTGKASLLLSYRMRGGGFQCYEVSERSTTPTSCNPNHPVAAAVLLGKDEQLVIESSGEVPVIRRYPPEFALEEFRFVSAALQGDTVLCGDGAVEKANKPGARACNDRKENGTFAAVLSPSGAYKATMTRKENVADAEISVANLLSGNEGMPTATTKVANYLGDRGALAIDDQGQLAYFQYVEGERAKALKGQVNLIVPGAKSSQPFISGNVPSCLSFSPKGKSGNEYLVVGTRVGEIYRYVLKAGAFELAIPAENARKADSTQVKSGVTACAIANDGAATVGLEDGRVLYFNSDWQLTELTERVVNRLPTAVKAVRIDDPDSGRRVTALGAWQSSNCLYPALPGQSLRVWELGDSNTEQIPVSNTCFPNQPVLALGGWKTKKSLEEPAPPAPGQAGAGGIPSGDGIRLLLPQGVSWHPCLLCRLKKDESIKEKQRRLVVWAKAKGGVEQNEMALKIRYGLTLGRW